MEPAPAAAAAWVSGHVGEQVTSSAALSGGLTSQMTPFSGAGGAGAGWVLRRITNEPWRTHGAALVERERAAQQALADTDVPAPLSIAAAPDGIDDDGVAAHLMTRLPGSLRDVVGAPEVTAMAALLARIHHVRPAVPFRAYQSWAWEGKWVIPPWSEHPDAWTRAFDVLAGEPPPFEPTFLHRDFHHRNLLWRGSDITGVVDWVETSTGPAWLDAAHAATNLAVFCDVERAAQFLADYARASDTEVERYWLVMDVVGFLPPPGKGLMFGEPEQVRRLDAWCATVMDDGTPCRATSTSGLDQPRHEDPPALG